MGGAARLTLIYPSTGLSVELLHPRLVLFTLVGQHFGLGSIPALVRALAFLKTARHIVPFVLGTRTQGCVTRVILVGLVQVLLVVVPAVMHAAMGIGIIE